RDGRRHHGKVPGAFEVRGNGRPISTSSSGLSRGSAMVAGYPWKSAFCSTGAAAIISLEIDPRDKPEDDGNVYLSPANPRRQIKSLSVRKRRSRAPVPICCRASGSE